MSASAPLRSTFALLCAAVLGACGSSQDPGAKPGGGMPPAQVEVVTVRSGLLHDVATFSGQLSAENSVLIESETEGIVSEIAFREGDAVKAGTLLLRLRDAEQRARLREAEANRALAREVHGRSEQLATRNAISAAAHDKAAAELKVSEARVALAQVELARTEIRAPFDGVLGMRFVALGDRIDAGAPIVQIDAVDRLQVSFAITELGILFAKVGAPVQVRVAPYPDQSFEGEVFFVSPTLDPATRRIIAKAWVANADHRLRPGLFASVDMEIDRREGAIEVPESAVIFDRQGTYVWRVNDERVAEKVPVQTGLRRKGLVEITMGLRDGEKIVASGTHKLRAGQPVLETLAGSGAPASAEPPAGGESGEGT